MQASEWVFFLGAAPGIYLVVRNMLWFHRVVLASEDMARKGGQWLDAKLCFACRSRHGGEKTWPHRELFLAAVAAPTSEPGTRAITDWSTPW
ncbi:hypothetical protein SAMN02800691_0105 [Luteibacter sp. UNCMF366Tsu5.1]|nr:hypothetical protein SAMN02800691_0105 [Luteibacter sp. UNCMF366Tsu5.1]